MSSIDPTRMKVEKLSTFIENEIEVSINQLNVVSNRQTVVYVSTSLAALLFIFNMDNLSQCNVLKLSSLFYGIEIVLSQFYLLMVFQFLYRSKEDLKTINRKFQLEFIKQQQSDKISLLYDQFVSEIQQADLKTWNSKLYRIIVKPNTVVQFCFWVLANILFFIGVFV